MGAGPWQRPELQGTNRIYLMLPEQGSKLKLIWEETTQTQSERTHQFPMGVL